LLFKNHVLLDHSNLEVQRVYGRPVETLIGKDAMKRLRTPIMKKIKQGKFSELVNKLLSTDFPFDGDKINREYPFAYEGDPLKR
jgi:uncharacterized protein YlaI